MTDYQYPPVTVPPPIKITDDAGAALLSLPKNHAIKPAAIAAALFPTLPPGQFNHWPALEITLYALGFLRCYHISDPKTLYYWSRDKLNRPQCRDEWYAKPSSKLIKTQEAQIYGDWFTRRPPTRVPPERAPKPVDTNTPPDDPDLYDAWIRRRNAAQPDFSDPLARDRFDSYSHDNGEPHPLDTR